MPLGPLKIEPAFPNLSLSRMVAMAYPDDGSDRLFVALQPGQIVVFGNDADVESAEVFLDIRDRVNDRGEEEGLLGLAFDPGFLQNGYFYLFYSASDPKRSVVSRFSVSPDGGRAGPGSERVLLEVSQPFSNHNGGQIVFGPEGYLYIGLGDGGSRGDSQGNGQ
ncbi:MAG: PQQ-dependent sugar dehydrogenase, partial [Chloroflexi bacterium]|nr:PQQ-dependent sugar dehydrogenase [Chloroflexota bacterium]